MHKIIKYKGLFLTLLTPIDRKMVSHILLSSPGARVSLHLLKPCKLSITVWPYTSWQEAKPAGQRLGLPGPTEAVPWVAWLGPHGWNAARLLLVVHFVANLVELQPHQAMLACCIIPRVSWKGPWKEAI